MGARAEPRSAAPGAKREAERCEVTRNSCALCSPLGATIAFAGIERGMTILHGSQGCATYIRRYVISHFREPLDVASSSFTEESAVFGGADQLRLALANLVGEYRPAFVGVATTCLAETIGEDAAWARKSLGLDASGAWTDLSVEPLIAAVSTPSYRGSHIEGFRAALRALTKAAVLRGAASRVPGPRRAYTERSVAVFPAMLSPADIRSLRSDIESFGLEAIFATDYSDTLDGGPWVQHRLLPAGGTPVADLARMRGSRAALELGSELRPELSAAAYLEEAGGVPRVALGLPVGIRATDALMAALGEISGRRMPARLAADRSRLLDSYVDAHKLVFGRKALLYGDIDFVEAIAAFLLEIGMIPVFPEGEGRDFYQAESAARGSAADGEPVDLVIGNGKGYKTAVRLGASMVRLGFPIHDRFGGQRVCVLGYGGSQELFDRIVNALIERRQDESEVGYTYY